MANVIQSPIKLGQCEGTKPRALWKSLAYKYSVPSAPPKLQQVERNYVLHRQKKLLYFGGCDYFRLASHPQVLRAVADGLRKFGLNVGASRLTTGNHPLYEQLERQVAAFFGAESALVVSSGYMTGCVVAQALAGLFTHVLLDPLSHSCLVDAAVFFGCPILRFRHRDPAHVAQIIRRLGRNACPILLTDGLFAHDGSVAPLKGYLKVLPRRASVLVDDAHGAGVIGRAGKGSLEFEGVSRQRLIHCVTLSKAFGVYGGAILGSVVLRQKLMRASRLFAGNTPLPLPLANGALAAVKVLRTDRGLRLRLRRNVGYVKSNLRANGLALPKNPGPMIPLVPTTPRAALQLQEQLLKAGIYPPFIKYSGGPKSGYFRFVISSGHTREQLNRLLEILLPIARGEEF